MSYPMKMELRNGTPIIVRPIETRDKKLLTAGFGLLSKRSRFNRFFRPVEKLSEKDLVTYCTVDQSDHIAIGALGMTHDNTLPLGIARCIRLKDRPHEAEVAVTVIDSFHRQGIGMTLLTAIAHAAAAKNITAFVGTILMENSSMLDLLTELGASSKLEIPGVLSVSVPIHTDARKYPDTAIGASVKKIYSLLNHE